MATFKAEVYAHQKKADGTYNIKIRVTHKQRKKYLATPWFVSKEDLTRSLKLKNQRYIDMVEEVIRRYRTICNDVGEALNDMSVEQVVELVTRKRENDSFKLDLVAYTKAYIQKLMDCGHIGNAKSYSVALNSMIKFAGRDAIDIREITVQFLNEWIAWIGGCKGCCRSQSLYIAGIRAMYNRAKREFNDEEAGVIRIPFNPFSKIDIPKPPMPKKRALTIEQMRAIAKLPYSDAVTCGVNRTNLAKDAFLLSFLLIGMNAVDLYTATDYQDGRITYQRTKTKNRRADGAEISIRVEPEARALFEKYRDGTGKRVFKFYKMYSSTDTFNAALNKGLKRIGKLIGVDNLDFYAARHSWATIAANDAEVDKYMVHTALNHVDENMRVTDIYIRKSWDGIDKANRRVQDLMNWDLSDVSEPKEL